MSALDDLITNLGNYKYNPAGMQSAIYNVWNDVSGGVIDVVDPTNPVAAVLEAACSTTAAFMVENKVLNRQQYPYSAQTPQDLYPHMSDLDYLNIFAVPATTSMFFVFSMNELINNLVALTDGSGSSMVVIPRNTYTTVSNITFSLQYPIQIIQLAHGGLQVVYDVSQVSPFQTLSSNIIPWKIITDTDGTEYLVFSITMTQFDIVSRTLKLQLGSPNIITIPITDQYCYSRVWADNGNGTFTELATTYTDSTYDLTNLTAVVKVIGQSVQIKIPQIYVTKGLLTSNIRADVYETKGAMSLNLTAYDQTQFQTHFFAVNSSELTAYTAPLSQLRSFQAYSVAYASGGSNALSFTDLRQRVITNAIGSPSLPITNLQVGSTLNRAGYALVKNIDTITNRNFLAVRPMPDPTDPNLLTAANAGIGVLSAKITDALQLSSVVDNGDGYTLVTPATLYRYQNGLLSFVSTAEATALAQLSPNQLSAAISTNEYLYSPFHYVLDSSQNEFNLRPYYLDNPSVISKSFVTQNASTMLQVSTNTYQLLRTSTGYKLHIETSSSQNFQQLADNQIYVQLAFVPPGEVDRAYVLGTLVGKDGQERIYEFDLSTNYSINPSHQLGMTQFEMYNTSSRVTLMPLQQQFDIIYSTTASVDSNWAAGAVDNVLGTFQLPTGIKGIVQEQINLNFGYFLEHLWARARTVVSANQYETWATNVPAVYSQDVYQPDPQTGYSFTVVNGTLTWTILHHAGDPVLDSNSNPVYAHLKGDIKLDAYGNPIVVQGRDLQRQMDLFVIDATYYFATNNVAVTYRTDLVNTVVNWLTVDLPAMGDDLLEETQLMFQPTTTIGSVNVSFGNGQTKTIPAGQSFVVNLYVPSNVYDNPDLTSALTNKTISSIATSLQVQTVATSDISDALRTVYGTDVAGFDISGLGDSLNLTVVTVLDGSRQLGLNKKLVARNDDTLAVVEDVTVNFIRYDTTAISTSA